MRHPVWLLTGFINYSRFYFLTESGLKGPLNSFLIGAPVVDLEIRLWGGHIMWQWHDPDIWLRGNLICFPVYHVYFFVGKGPN